MNEASRWRFALAERVGRAYAANPKAAVVQVAGSTGRGTADRYSDIEIDVYWSEPPTDDERRAAVRRSGGILLELHAYEEDEWAESISLGSFHMHTSTFLVETMERYLHEVIDEYSTALNPHMRLYSLLHTRTLAGEDLAARWQKRARAYPPELAEAVVREHLSFGRLGYYGAVFAARDDLLPLYDIFCDTEREMLWVLLGLNRLYIPTPSLKQSGELISEMRIAPPDLARRLKAAFRSPPEEGVTILYKVCEEVLELVEAHLPGIDVAERRQWLTTHRGIWDEPPEI